MPRVFSAAAVCKLALSRAPFSTAGFSEGLTVSCQMHDWMLQEAKREMVGYHGRRRVRRLATAFSSAHSPSTQVNILFSSRSATY